MAKFTEETLTGWTKPPSTTEELKLQNAERMVREALNNDEKLKQKSIAIFGQGSYANDTNVKLDSDIDINVCYQDGFYFKLAEGVSEEDVKINTLPSVTYTFQEYKDDVYNALINKFGKDSIVRNNKCITVLANSYRVETDVVPTWEFRRYDSKSSTQIGTKFLTDSLQEVINYPKQHIENGINKNSLTSRRFKRLTRLHKKLRYKMLDERIILNSNITSFLLECLIWNLPNEIMNNHDTWNERLRYSIIFLFENTKEEKLCSEWGEVSDLLYLFKGNKKWSHEDVNEYMLTLWRYLEY